jgi:SET domain-containing protein
LKCISETKEHPKGVCTAIQDIAPGDEFLCNYAGFSSGDLFRALGL